jgi:hypothetical protein
MLAQGLAAGGQEAAAAQNVKAAMHCSAAVSLTRFDQV